MTRNEMILKLEYLGFKSLMEDGKTLSAYYWLHDWLQGNRTPIKDVETLYLSNGTVRAIFASGDDLETPITLAWYK